MVSEYQASHQRPILSIINFKNHSSISKNTSRKEKIALQNLIITKNILQHLINDRNLFPINADEDDR